MGSERIHAIRGGFICRRTVPILRRLPRPSGSSLYFRPLRSRRCYSSFCRETPTGQSPAPKGRLEIAPSISSGSGEKEYGSPERAAPNPSCTRISCRPFGALRPRSMRYSLVGPSGLRISGANSATQTNQGQREGDEGCQAKGRRHFIVCLLRL